MKKYRLGLLLNLILAIFAFPQTYALWTNALTSEETVCNSNVRIGIWKRYIVLEEVGKLVKPKEGTEFLYKGQVYAVLTDLDQDIPAEDSWWGWNNKWSMVNLLTEDWVSTNYYGIDSLPVRKDGVYYLPIHDGATNQVPGEGNAWFRVSEWYISTNIYLKGYIVKHGVNFDGSPRYWIAKDYVNAGTAPGVFAWAWDEVPNWSGEVEEDAVVYTASGDGSVRFWKALHATAAEPSEVAAQAGLFQEIKNAWISPADSHQVLNFWLGHNKYSAGEIVVYGADNCRRYRYFQAVKEAVGIPPFSIQNGQEVINNQYWKEIG